MNPLVQLHKSPAAFSERALPFLLESEAENNILIGILERKLGEPALGKDEVLASVHEGKREGESLRGIAIRTVGQKIALSAMPEAGAIALAETVQSLVSELPGVIGPGGASKAFARRWGELHQGLTLKPGLRMTIMAAEKIEAPKPDGGRCMVASSDHADVIARWARKFNEDIGLNVTPILEERVRSLIGSRDFFFWHTESGEPRSMAAKVRDSPNGATVSMVSTPPEFRGKGYAGRCVAGLCEAMFARGKKFCALYAELDNLTSTGLYERLGFRDVGRAEEVRFEPRGGG